MLALFIWYPVRARLTFHQFHIRISVELHMLFDRLELNAIRYEIRCAAALHVHATIIGLSDERARRMAHGALYRIVYTSRNKNK